ncbi:MAG: ABC transporter ATP-binding protein [Clostridiales bacterium]|nr:ABC transporter ATP-binding protein [Clostridiales bacterium]
MIHATELVKSFDGRRALDGFSINVPRGSVYGLVGPNGAGKSTFLRHAAGVYAQDSGSLTIDGQPVFENTAVKARISYIPDDLFFFLQASQRDMMKFYKGIYPQFSTERYEKLKEVFKLDEKTPIRKFSKGMQKQSAFWLSMCMMPDILLLDEPVDGLDPVMRRQIWSLILSDVAERGTTVLVSSHNLRELEDVCDNVGIVHQGKMLLERSLSEIQGNTVKLQIVPKEGAALPEGLDILHESSTGRMKTLIVRGTPSEISARAHASAPVYYELLPLTLEEIFIYELGGVDYAVNEIIL